jgi:hypothetical protein
MITTDGVPLSLSHTHTQNLALYYNSSTLGPTEVLEPLDLQNSHFGYSIKTKGEYFKCCTYSLEEKNHKITNDTTRKTRQ